MITGSVACMPEPKDGLCLPVRALVATTRLSLRVRRLARGLEALRGWRLSSFSEGSGTMAKEASGGKEDEAVSTSAVSPFRGVTLTHLWGKEYGSQPQSERRGAGSREQGRGVELVLMQIPWGAVQVRIPRPLAHSGVQLLEHGLASQSCVLGCSKSAHSA